MNEPLKKAKIPVIPPLPEEFTDNPRQPIESDFPILVLTRRKIDPSASEHPKPKVSFCQLMKDFKDLRLYDTGREDIISWCAPTKVPEKFFFSPTHIEDNKKIYEAIQGELADLKKKGPPTFRDETSEFSLSEDELIEFVGKCMARILRKERYYLQKDLKVLSQRIGSLTTMLIDTKVNTPMMEKMKAAIDDIIGDFPERVEFDQCAIDKSDSPWDDGDD